MTIDTPPPLAKAIPNIFFSLDWTIQQFIKNNVLILVDECSSEIYSQPMSYYSKESHAREDNEDVLIYVHASSANMTVHT